MSTPPAPPTNAFSVELPAGGFIHLRSSEEVDLFQTSVQRYVEDFHLTKQNDLVILGGLVQQQVLLFRAQRKINGMTPLLDNNGVPTGQYTVEELGADDARKWRDHLNDAMDEIRKAEKALGIDKVSREQGGTFSLQDYVKTLKRAAHERGIHLNKRFIEMERIVNETRTKIRMLRNLDPEDRNYEGVPDSDAILNWLEGELKELELADQRYAKHGHKLYVGKL